MTEHTVTAIHAFSDNYIWAIGNNTNKNIVLVDPGDATVCINYIEANQLKLIAILITHHHQDHIGGIKELVTHYQSLSIKVYGPEHESIPLCTHQLAEGDVISLDDILLSLSVLDLPGHTSGHIAYVSSNMNNPLLFCGDTLFSGGCGRLFEGTAQQMLKSLTKLKCLPDHTKVYCAHEYTLSNLKFALAVEPNNDNLLNYYQQVKQLRAQNKPTIPTTIGLEKNINPFLRTENIEVKQSAEKYSQQTLTSSVLVFAAIRQYKDNF